MPKRFLSFTVFELIAVVVTLAVIAAAVLYYVNPERKEIQARNAERGIEMQAYMDAMRQKKKDQGEFLYVLQKIPAHSIEIGTCAECFNLERHLVPKYLDELPLDPLQNSKEKTGYYIRRDEEGFVYIEAPHAELGLDLVDKERI